MIVCSYCSHTNPSESKFCNMCGFGLESSLDPSHFASTHKGLVPLNTFRFEVSDSEYQHVKSIADESDITMYMAMSYIVHTFSMRDKKYRTSSMLDTTRPTRVSKQDARYIEARSYSEKVTRLILSWPSSRVLLFRMLITWHKEKYS